MTQQALAIAAENQRRRIPTDWLAHFDQLTNDELAYMADHSEATATLDHGDKVPAASLFGWELEYREAFGIEVYIDHDTGELRRRRLRR